MTRTGKARSSTAFAGTTLPIVPSTAPRMNLPPPVMAYSPYASELADQPMTAPSVRFAPTLTAARSSGRPFCTHTKAPSGASSGIAEVSAASLASVRVQRSIRS